MKIVVPINMILILHLWDGFRPYLRPQFHDLILFFAHNEQCTFAVAPYWTVTNKHKVLGYNYHTSNYFTKRLVNLHAVDLDIVKVIKQLPKDR